MAATSTNVPVLIRNVAGRPIALSVHVFGGIARFMMLLATHRLAASAA